jgi:hypothetical protein
VGTFPGGDGAGPTVSTLAGDVLAGLADHSARLRVIERRLAAIETLLMSPRRPPSTTTDDLALATAIADATEGRVFSCRDLCDHRAVDPALAAVVGDLSPSQVGRRLQRLQDHDLGGLGIVRVGADKRGALWMVTLTRIPT